MKQAAFFAGSQDGDGVGGAGGTKVGAFEGINSDIDGGIMVVLIVHGGADSLANEKHGRFITFAFTDDDGAVHRNVIHHLTHSFGGSLVGLMTITGTHGACGGDGRLLDHAQQFQAELNLHRYSRCIGHDQGA